MIGTAVHCTDEFCQNALQTNVLFVLVSVCMCCLCVYNQWQLLGQYVIYKFYVCSPIVTIFSSAGYKDQQMVANTNNITMYPCYHGSLGGWGIICLMVSIWQIQIYLMIPILFLM